MKGSHNERKSLFCNKWELTPKYASYREVLVFAGILSFKPPISTEKKDNLPLNFHPRI